MPEEVEFKERIAHLEASLEQCLNSAIEWQTQAIRLGYGMKEFLAASEPRPGQLMLNEIRDGLWLQRDPFGFKLRHREFDGSQWVIRLSRNDILDMAMVVLS